MKKTISILKVEGLWNDSLAIGEMLLEAVAKCWKHDFQLRRQNIFQRTPPSEYPTIDKGTAGHIDSSDAILMGCVLPRFDPANPADIITHNGIFDSILKYNNTTHVIQSFADNEAVVYPIPPLKDSKSINLVLFQVLSPIPNNIRNTPIWITATLQNIAHQSATLSKSRYLKETFLYNQLEGNSNREWHNTIYTYFDRGSGLNYQPASSFQGDFKHAPGMFDIIIADQASADEITKVCYNSPILPGMQYKIYSGNKRIYSSPYPFKAPAEDDKLYNPLGIILSVIQLLTDLGLAAEARGLRKATTWCLKNNILPADLDPENGYHPNLIAEIIRERIEKQLAPQPELTLA